MLDKIERIEIDDDEIRAMNIRFPESTRAGRTVVEIKSLTKKYDNKIILDNIDFFIERGDRIAFVGKNGEGKSTLSKIIAGLEVYEGDMIKGHNMELSYFAQLQADDLPSDKTVFQTIDDAATGTMRTQVRNVLAAFLFSGDDQEKKVKVLSGGEKSRLALAKLILKPANLIILDEPTNHLDMISKDVLKQALLNFGGALIIVSHDREFLSGLTNRTIEFKNKKIKEFKGEIEDYLRFFNNERIDENFLSEKNIEKTEKEKTTNQIDREKRKDLNRELSKLKKEIEKVESDISQLEFTISETELIFSDQDCFKRNDIEKLQQQYSKDQENLKNKIELWEDLLQKTCEIEEQL